jgi:hypothetical protein
MANRLGPEL